MNKYLSQMAGVLMALLAAGAHASDGTITFTGNITSSTCTVTPASKTLVVTLPSVVASSMTAAGQTAGATQFAINVTGCTGADTSANAFFENSTNTNATGGRLKNTGSAGHVEIQILAVDGSPVNLAGVTGSQNQAGPATIASGAATQVFTARYYATGAVTAGNVASIVTYSMVYN